MTRLYITLLLAWCALFMTAGDVAAAREPDQTLIKALKRHSYDADSQSIDTELLIWLGEMSNRLEPRIKSHRYRVHMLRTIYDEARTHRLDPQLMIAVIDVESGFNHVAISNKGALGLMQIMPFWKKHIGKRSDDLFNPYTNIRYGATILRHYLDRYGNAHDALAAYNGSLGRSKYPNKVASRLRTRYQYEVFSSALPSTALALAD